MRPPQTSSRVLDKGTWQSQRSEEYRKLGEARRKVRTTSSRRRRTRRHSTMGVIAHAEYGPCMRTRQSSSRGVRPTGRALHAEISIDSADEGLGGGSKGHTWRIPGVFQLTDPRVADQSSRQSGMAWFLQLSGKPPTTAARRRGVLNRTSGSRGRAMGRQRETREQLESTLAALTSYRNRRQSSSPTSCVAKGCGTILDSGEERLLTAQRHEPVPSHDDTFQGLEAGAA